MGKCLLELGPSGTDSCEPQRRRKWRSAMSSWDSRAMETWVVLCRNKAGATGKECCFQTAPTVTVSCTGWCYYRYCSCYLQYNFLDLRLLWLLMFSCWSQDPAWQYAMIIITVERWSIVLLDSSDEQCSAIYQISWELLMAVIGRSSVYIQQELGIKLHGNFWLSCKM